MKSIKFAASGVGIVFLCLFCAAIIAVPAGITIYGVISAFQAHVLTGLISLVPPCGFVQGMAMLFHYNIAKALIAFLVANGAHF